MTMKRDLFAEIAEGFAALASERKKKQRETKS